MLRPLAALVLILPVFRAAGAPAPAPPPPVAAQLAADVAVRLGTDDARLAVGVWMSGSEFCEALNENGSPVDSNLSHEFRIVRHGKPLATGRASLQMADKTCRFAAEFMAHRQLQARGIGYLLTMYGGSHAGREWKADDAQNKFPTTIGKVTLKNGKTTKFTVESDGQTWMIAFSGEMAYTVSDRRSQGSADFEVAFVPKGKLSLAAKASSRAVCTLKTSVGTVRAEARSPVRLSPDGNWSVLDSAESVKLTSALDFSRLARKPVAGRQYGVRLTRSQVLQDADAAALLARQFVRSGMTSVELAEFAGKIQSDDASVGLGRDALLAFDGFVRAMKKEELSVVCDFQDARNPDWKRLGVTAPEGRKDPPSRQLSSALAAFSEKAHGEWKMAADAFYSHKPLKSSRAFAEDRSLADVCLGSGLFTCWRELLSVPEVIKNYSEWLQEKRKGNPDFMKDAVCEPMDLKLFTIWEPRYGSVRRFLAEREAELMEKRSQCLRGLKIKAVMVAAPGVTDFKDVAAVRGGEGEMFASTFSVDSPRQQGEDYRYPYAIRNVNPFRFGEPFSKSLDWHRTEKRDFGIVSWSAPAPSAWRVGVGLYLGARAAKENWKFLFRACTADPMAQLFDRAIAALYLRGDFAAEPSSALALKDGGFTVSTPSTCGGFSPLPNGKIAAGCLEAKLGLAPAAVWISSLSDRPLSRSRRLLLTHVTDIQRNGAVFADSRRQQLLAANGGGYLVRTGTATVTISGIEKPRSCHVVSLRADGTRSRQLKTQIENGNLIFDVSTRGEAEGQTTYEIFKD